MSVGVFATLVSWVMTATGGDPVTAALIAASVVLAARNSRKLERIESTAETAHRVVAGEDEVESDGLVAALEDVEERVDELEERVVETRRRVAVLGGANDA